MTDDFLPSRLRAAQIVARIYERLDNSLLHIAERATLALGRDFSGEIRRQITRPDERSYIAPALFAVHNAALNAAKAGDVDQLERLFKTIAGRSWTLQHREIIAFDPVQLEPLIFELYNAALAADTTTQVNVAAPSAELAQQARKRINDALSLLARSAPDLAVEVNAALAQIVLVSEGKGRVTFAGASSFDLWGAIFLNTDAYVEEADLLIGIVHEVAHLMLFAGAIEGPLVLNDPKEVYPSPLRVDPRPMDGIFHATFVTARMHLAGSALLASDYSAGPARRSKLQSEVEYYEQLFWDGQGTIEQHGQLTDLGRRLMGAATDYMRTHGRGSTVNRTARTD